MTMHVRIKPYDGKKHVRRTYTCFGIKFLESAGWYKVDDDVADYLRTVKQIETDEDSLPAFDVCTEKEAKDLERREHERKKASQQLRAKSDEARQVHVDRARRAPGRGDLLPADLPENQPPAPRERPNVGKSKDGFDDQDDTFPGEGKPFEASRSNAEGRRVIPDAMVDGAEDDGEPAETPDPDAASVAAHVDAAMGTKAPAEKALPRPRKLQNGPRKPKTT